MIPVSCFDSDKFRLRLLQADDETLFCDLFTDNATMQLIGTPLSKEAAASFFHSAQRANLRQPSRDLFYGIRCHRTGDDIGLCTLQRIDWISRCAEVGLMLRLEKQHRGLGREILSRLVRSAFDTFGFERLQAAYHVENRAARRVFAACGFGQIEDIQPGVASQVEKAMLTAHQWRTRSVGTQR